ncbi:MAG: hypothetical protein KF708_15525 [Pirellulales bacterium]|nr:hypothetical protein [Pirellulales bacterium]
MRRRRAAFSLLEVLLATGILLGAVAVLGELARLGRLNALAARDQTQAQLLCESKLAEILAGAASSESHGDQPLEDAPGWLWRVDREPLEQPGLSSLRVTVAQDLPEAKRPVRFALVRWMRDASSGAPNAPGLESPRSPASGAASLSSSLPLGE